MFETLTALIPKIENATSYGEWVLDGESAGTIENPTQMPYVRLDDASFELFLAVHDCVSNNSEAISTNYLETLESYGIEGEEGLSSLDISTADVTLTFAAILTIVRQDKFCEGLLLEYLKNGKMLEWLKHLKKLEEK